MNYDLVNFYISKMPTHNEKVIIIAELVVISIIAIAMTLIIIFVAFLDNICRMVLVCIPIIIGITAVGYHENLKILYPNKTNIKYIETHKEEINNIKNLDVSILKFADNDLAIKYIKLRIEQGNNEEEQLKQIENMSDTKDKISLLEDYVKIKNNESK